MRRYMSYAVVCALAALQFAAGQTLETEKAATCLGHFTLAGKTCDGISAFAHCLALTDINDPFRANAEKLLVEAQLATQGCKLRVKPSIKVVDRQVRSLCHVGIKLVLFMTGRGCDA